MFQTLSLCVAAVVSAPSIETGTLLTFQGYFEAEKGNPAETRKSFELTFLIANHQSDGVTLLWTLHEQGRGSFLWTDHFGRVQINADSGTGPHLPALLYVRPKGKSIVPVRPPVFYSREPLTKGQRFSRDKLLHEVKANTVAAKRKTWTVEARNRYGHKRTVWVEETSPLVVRMVETVFIGQGEQHELGYELTAAKKLSSQETEAAVQGFDLLSKLRESLKRTPRSSQLAWNDTQLAKIRKELPAITKTVKAGPLIAVLKRATQDAKEQDGRAGAVAKLEKRLVGKKLKLDLQDLRTYFQIYNHDQIYNALHIFDKDFFHYYNDHTYPLLQNPEIF